MALSLIIILEDNLGALAFVSGSSLPGAVFGACISCSREFITGSHLIAARHDRHAVFVCLFLEDKVRPAGQEFIKNNALGGLQAHLKFRRRMIVIGGHRTGIGHRRAVFAALDGRAVRLEHMHHLMGRFVFLVRFIP